MGMEEAGDDLHQRLFDMHSEAFSGGSAFRGLGLDQISRWSSCYASSLGHKKQVTMMGWFVNVPSTLYRKRASMITM